MRKANVSDYDEVVNVVNSLDLHENLLSDLQRYNKYRRDQVIHMMEVR